MKKTVKHIINTLLSLMLILGAFFSTSISAHAASEKTFIPFRSDYVKYISQHAADKSDAIQYVWLKLFEEETSLPENQWARTYFCDYTDTNGVTTSTQDNQATYSPKMDTFLKRTVSNNDTFVINWINEIPTVFTIYCKSIKDHRPLADGIIKLTESGLYLGGGKDAKNNTFLMGANSTSSDKGGAKWQATETTSATHDIDILRCFGANFTSLSKTQKDWVKTYMEWLVNDYATNKDNGIASKKNSIELYNLMAVSYAGFNHEQLKQEFFDYCISTPEVHVGDLIVNAADGLDKTDLLHDLGSDISKNTDMTAIWLSDADCDYQNGWPGDDDYDWLCYNICFDKDPLFTRLKELVSGNSTTAAQMEDWLLRYYSQHPSSGPIKYAIDNSGKTISAALISNQRIARCDHSATPGKVESFWCGGHHAYAGASAHKPLGVQYISFSTFGCDSASYNWRVYDGATGATISSGGAGSSPSIRIPAKYIWSNNVVVSVSITYNSNALGHVGDGACKSGYVNTNINWTYVTVTDCQKQGHHYGWSFKWNDDHSCCTATGVCTSCGDTKTLTDTDIIVSKEADGISYTAPFKHTCVNGTKTDVVKNGSGKEVYSGTSNSQYLSGKLTETDSVSRTYHGIGFTLDTNASTTVSLAAGAIKPGAVSISVSCNGSICTFRLMNKDGLVDEMTVTSYNQGTCAYTFDCSDYTDQQMDGMYLVCNLSSSSHFQSGMDEGYVATCKSQVIFNSIEVNYK